VDRRRSDGRPARKSVSAGDERMSVARRSGRRGKRCCAAAGVLARAVDLVKPAPCTRTAWSFRGPSYNVPFLHARREVESAAAREACRSSIRETAQVRRCTPGISRRARS